MEKIIGKGQNKIKAELMRRYKKNSLEDFKKVVDVF